MSRNSGVLLHPTSLPGPYGVGDFGGALPFLDLLGSTGTTWWQILPLGPPDRYGSPYASTSSFALNPTLIDPTILQEHVSEDAWETFLDNVSLYDDDFFDVESVTSAKLTLLEEAYNVFEPTDTFHAFCEKEASWLTDFALFSAIRSTRNQCWWDWPTELRVRSESAIAKETERLTDEIQRAKYIQWLADQQWQATREHAAKRNVSIMGDIPIFVSMDSADVWGNQSLFLVENGTPAFVAGVPPDYFSPTGQKWGNPLYDWDAMEADGYAWWRARIERVLSLANSARIDHFRGFSEYWAVPYDAPTAETGEWRPGPKHAFFSFVKETFGDVPFVAEDLGLITPDVIELRDAYDLPGMKVMQFAFDDDNSDHPFRPHTYPARCVAYLGTHDNDTTQGWLDSTYESTRDRIRRYLDCDDDHMLDAMMDALFASNADTVVTTPQDLLRLGTEARMNAPGNAEGNWSWRMTFEQLEDEDAWNWLAKLNQENNR